MYQVICVTKLEQIVTHRLFLSKIWVCSTLSPDCKMQTCYLKQMSCTTFKIMLFLWDYQIKYSILHIYHLCSGHRSVVSQFCRNKYL